jgi:hypothetical protein
LLELEVSEQIKLKILLVYSYYYPYSLHNTNKIKMTSLIIASTAAFRDKYGYSLEESRGGYSGPTSEQTEKFDSLVNEFEKEANELASLSMQIASLSMPNMPNMRLAQWLHAQGMFPEPPNNGTGKEILERILRDSSRSLFAQTNPEHRNNYRIITLGIVNRKVRQAQESAKQTILERTKMIDEANAKKLTEQQAEKIRHQKEQERKEISDAISFIIATKMPKEITNQPLSSEEFAKKKVLEEWNAHHHLIPPSLKEDALRLYRVHLAEKAKAVEKLSVSGW